MSSSDAAQATGDSGQTGAAKRPEGKTLGKYEIQKKIGAGGMGTVFLALDTELRRTVALKVLPKERAQNPMLVRRFKSEGQAAAHLRHPNLVSVFEAGEIDGYLYLALEYVDGTDVHQLVEKRGPVPVKRSIAIVRQVAKALEHAFEQNIVHRDIKPSNLLIQRDGSVKLTDFGLARSLDEETETSITRAGTTVGTVDYMSPEQARDSKAADIRSDIYSLGCTWYHMLTGGPPYPDGAVTNKLQAHAALPPPDPRDKNDSVPEAVVAILQRMMAKEPSARYQTPREVLEDLDSTALNRQALSNNVLAALAEGDSDARSRPARKAPAPAAAPVEKKPVVAAPTGKNQPDPELVRYLIIGGIVLGTLALAWWAMSQFASTMETPSNTPNPFQSANEVPRYGDEQPKESAPAASAVPPAQPDREPVASRDAPEQPAEPASPAPADENTTESSVADARTDDADAAGEQSLEAAVALRQGETPPDWVPDLVTSTARRSGNDGRPLAVLTVGRANGEPGRFARLETALARVPRTGGVIQLAGPGPYELTPTRIGIDGPLIIEAAAGQRPVIVLTPNQDGAAGRILQVEGGALALAGLDLVAVGRQFPSSQPLALIEVLGGDLVVRSCTATLVGERPGPAAAFRALDRLVSAGGGARADPGRVLLDRTFTRGSGLSALAISRAACDAVVANCLFVTGDAPVVALSEPPAEPAAGAAQTDPGRAVRLFSTTAVTSRSGFFFEHRRGTPPDTAVATVNSVIAAPPGAESASLVEFGEWPGTERAAGPLMRPRGLSVRVSSSVFPGWKQLIRAADRPQAVSGPSAWSQVWQEQVPLSAFPAPAWPQRRLDPASARPQDLEIAAGGVTTITGTDGQPPGVRSADVPQPPAEFMDRVAAVAERPVSPADADTGPLGARRIAIDLSKQDLGAVISRGDWESGTRFVASGAGDQRTQPIEVRGKSLSIEFVQTEGRPLRIEPQSSSFTGGGRSLFSIEDGSLRLVNGRFGVPASARGDGPRWFLHVTDGSFSLADCFVEGPLTPTTGWDGFLRWEQRERPDSPPEAPGRYEEYGRIGNSYLYGYGTLLRAEMRGRAFVARGSILATADDGFQLDIRGDDTRIHAAIELVNCTVSAGGTFFDVQAQRRAQAMTAPLRFFVEQTVFAPLESQTPAAKKPVLFRDPFAVRQQRQLEWWGQANGYASGIAPLLVESSAGGTTQDVLADWRKAWGPAGDIRPLAGPGGVLLKNHNDRPEFRELTAADFALDESAGAGAWAADGQPIGADAAGLARQAGVADGVTPGQ